MGAFVDRAIDELGLSKHRGKEAAAMALASIRARQLLNGILTIGDVSREELFELYQETDNDEIYDQWRLHFADEDLQESDFKYYWEGVDQDNIKRIDEETCKALAKLKV